MEWGLENGQQRLSGVFSSCVLRIVSCVALLNN